MSGKRYLLDTNAVIYLLSGKPKLIDLLKDASWIGISVITVLEFLSYKGITQTDSENFSKFTNRVDIIDIMHQNFDLITLSVVYRQKLKLKLPDAVIAATAESQNALLVTADKDLFILPESMIYRLV